MYIRFQFRRGNDLKFIGHLDILRLFERVFKRSGLLIAHSQGFNPRPQIIFGQPMPLGLTSDGEFADVELTSRLDPGQFLQIMNDALPPGIRLMDAKEKKNPSNLMGQISAASYRIGFKASAALDLQKLTGDILATDTILVMKKTKSGDKEKNIRPFIYELAGTMGTDGGFFEVLLGAGQDDNIRPDLFLKGVSDTFQAGLELMSMHRVLLMGGKEKNWLSLLDDQML
ncbi:MAG: TIGR03936 family radical SAM-associated protein [Thermoclostridium sp.]|nr:TIGR03936 family radical SAM-associated protein [Thermoclostridium sp.]